jgi:DHA2 family multidrug resistance protein
MGLIVMPMNVMAYSTLAPYLRPDGSSLMSLFRSLGGSVGISLLVTVLGRMQQVNHAELGTHITDQSVPAVDLSALADRFPSFGTGVMAVIDGEVNRQAMMIAFLDSFVLLFWMLLVFAPMVFLLKRAKAGVPQGQPMLSE